MHVRPLIFCAAVEIGIVLLLATVASAQSWWSCQAELDQLGRAASDASYAATRVRSAASDMESKESDRDSAASSLRLCRLSSRHCYYEENRYRSAVNDYESARDDFESAKSRLRSQLGTVSSYHSSVTSSCGYFEVSGRAGADRYCTALQRLKGQVPPDKLMEMCRSRSRSDEECQKCLRPEPTQGPQR